MNTEIDNNTGADNNLQGAFGDRGTNVNAIGYSHPHGEKIMSEIKEMLRASQSGNLLLVLIDKNQIPVNIMKGNGETGFSPEMMSIIMQIPGKVDKATGEHVILLAKALHEAAQELGGHKTPDPMKDIKHYSDFIHSRNLDSLREVLQIIKELTNSSYFSVLLDSLEKLGLNDMYKAYIDGASREQLYEKYAEAYDRQVEGV